ncbi:MAG TPA: DUF3576 domain-containing protein [Micropepsaceae bacterium]|nr:DUF3576 domain-containing protein [Micropepsaceae bacterium]
MTLMMRLPGAARFAALVVGLGLSLSACGSTRSDDATTYPDDHNTTEGTSLLDSINIFSSGGDESPGLGVNAYLWRASLDTLSFMPLASADLIGGVILTDWYAPPSAAGERLKVSVYILDRELRADALRVSAFRQTLQNGQWVDSAVDPQTTVKIENAILTRARQLKAEAR